MTREQYLARRAAANRVVNGALQQMTRVVTEFHPLQDVDANAPGYDVSGILKTGALNRYYRRKATVDSSYHGPERREHFTPPTGNGKLAPDAFDNLDSLEF